MSRGIPGGARLRFAVIWGRTTAEGLRAAGLGGEGGLGDEGKAGAENGACSTC
jgi:hypothetical protein